MDALWDVHFFFVREGGLEPPCPHGHTDLNRARLPISPLARDRRRRVVNSARLARCVRMHHVGLVPRLDDSKHGESNKEHRHGGNYSDE